MPRNLSGSCGERERDDKHVWNDKRGRFSINWLKLFQFSVAVTLKVRMSIIPHWVTELQIFSSHRMTYLGVWKPLSDFASNICPKEVRLTDFSSFFSVYVRKFQDSTSNFDTMCLFLYSIFIKYPSYRELYMSIRKVEFHTN